MWIAFYIKAGHPLTTWNRSVIHRNVQNFHDGSVSWRDKLRLPSSNRSTDNLCEEMICFSVIKRKGFGIQYSNSGFLQWAKTFLLLKNQSRDRGMILEKYVIWSTQHNHEHKSWLFWILLLSNWIDHPPWMSIPTISSSMKFNTFNLIFQKKKVIGLWFPR